MTVISARPPTRTRTRWPVAAVAVVLLLAGHAALTTGRAQAAGVLLSQGKPATASSVENGRHAGRHRGRRQRRHPLVQRVQRPAVDPGRPRRHRHHRPGRAELGGRVRHGLPDPGLRRRRPPGPPSTPPPPAPAARRPSPSPAPAGTCACYGTARATGYGYSLWEFQVFGTTGGTDRQPPAGTPISQFKPVAASSWEGGNAPAAALDGRTTTRWSQPVQRSTVDPGRPRRHRDDQPGGAQLGGGVRDRRTASRSPTTRPPGPRSTPPPPAAAASRR